jgi:hypothetical protein
MQFETDMFAIIIMSKSEHLWCPECVTNLLIAKIPLQIEPLTCGRCSDIKTYRYHILWTVNQEWCFICAEEVRRIQNEINSKFC